MRSGADCSPNWITVTAATLGPALAQCAGLLVVDGYTDLDPGGRPGLGAHAHAEFGIPVIGVAKSRFRTATHAVPVMRGSSARPLFITAAGMSPRRRSGPGPAHGRPPARLTYADARNAE